MAKGSDFFSISNSESVAGLAGSIASVFSKHIITACRTFRLNLTNPQCHPDRHVQGDQVCCVDADPTEHRAVRRQRGLSHHLRLPSQVGTKLNTDDFAADICFISNNPPSQVIYKQPPRELH